MNTSPIFDVNGAISPGEESARILAYRVLSRGLIYPTEDWLAGLPAWRNALQEVFGHLQLPAAEVIEALASLSDDQAVAFQKLQVEYTRLFINAVPKVLAPPYASAYTEQGLLMGEPAEAVLRAYREAGLAFATETHELPDHLAVELEFMFYLGYEEQAARTRGDLPRAGLLREQQRDFLNCHLLPWVPTWQQRVARADRVGFYSALARLTETWLRTDAATLAVPFS